jgi:uncharacterized protein YfdQ (DUF2303 family)
MNTQPEINTGSAVEAIAKLAKDTVLRHALISGTQVPALVWPDKTITTLEHLTANPTRKRASATFYDVPSFVAYIKAHRVPGTIVTGNFDQNKGEFVALLDFHEPNRDATIPPGATATEVAATAGTMVAIGLPNWTEHVVKLVLIATPEWARWLSKDKADLAQLEFAEFVEDNAQDITVPEVDGAGFPNQAELLSTALTLQVKTGVAFRNAVRLQNGHTQLNYQELVEGGHGEDGALVVPEKFALAIAPFTASPKYLVKARLRYRAASGKATFKYLIERPHKIVEHAYNDVKNALVEQLGQPVLYAQITPDVRR